MKYKIAFLDRDGVVNKDNKYVYKISEFEFVEGIFEFCRFLLSINYKIFVITNQSGIARGYFSEEDYHTLTKWINSRFIKERIKIESFIHCPFHPESKIKIYKKDSFMRKPNPGMIKLVEKSINIDKSKSFIVGDKESDIECGFRAGLKYGFLIKNNIKISNNLLMDKKLFYLKRVNNFNQINESILNKIL